MELELLRSFCLGAELSSFARQNYPQEDTMPCITKLLREIAAGEFTLREPPCFEASSESSQHLVNVAINIDKEVAEKIVDQMGPEQL